MDSKGKKSFDKRAYFKQKYKKNYGSQQEGHGRALLQKKAFVRQYYKEKKWQERKEQKRLMQDETLENERERVPGPTMEKKIKKEPEEETAIKKEPEEENCFISVRAKMSDVGRWKKSSMFRVCSIDECKSCSLFLMSLGTINYSIIKRSSVVSVKIMGKNFSYYPFLNQVDHKSPASICYRKQKISSLKRARLQYHQKVLEKKKKKEAAIQKRKEIAMAKIKRKEERLKRFKKLNQKTKKGQPVMRGRIELMLE
ncbi:thyroid transcription factor 1-associated protein 26 homolog, partial [Macrobrachium nipponense]|uniref:thyroid transcription factor 1-associated protein 26 homolog n=1 Tax=Macrobrachium nipponense TaxID=159736 RepID=UPI0030C7FAD3